MRKSFKTLSLLAASVLTLGFVSCSSDSEVEDVVVGKAATLNIVLSSPNTRAAGTDGSGDLERGNDQSINDYYVFTFNAAGTMLSNNAFTGSPSGATQITTTTAASTVYVLANTGTDFHTTLNGCTNKTAVDNLLVDLDDDGLQNSARWISGESAIDWDGTTSASVTVKAYYIASRITVKVVNNMKGYTHDENNEGALKIENVLVMNANGWSKLFGDRLYDATNPYKQFYSAISYDGFSVIPVPEIATAVNIPATSGLLMDDFNEDDFYVSEDDNNTRVFYYYVFERSAVADASGAPTIVTLKGSYNGTDTYFPVHLSAQEFPESTGKNLHDKGLERGKSYDITIKLNADLTSGGGGGGGTTDPTQPVVEGEVEVTLEVIDWVSQEFEKQFN